MQKWEYCFIVWTSRPIASVEERDALLAEGVSSDALNESGGRIVLEMGYLTRPGSSELPTPVIFLGTTMNELGQDGWELVTTSKIDPTFGTERFYFKRPLASP